MKTSKRRIKKKNHRRHSEILDYLKMFYKISNIKYGDGYFIFEMGPHAVCHFTISDGNSSLLGGIWLKDDSYSIFAEHKAVIDKFKPTATRFSADNIPEFIDQIQKYFNGDLLDYQDEIDHWISYRNRVEKNNKKVQLKLDEICVETDLYRLSWIDRNSPGCSVYPRYEIRMFIREDHIDDDKLISEVYSRLANDLETLETDEQIMFEPLGKSLIKR